MRCLILLSSLQTGGAERVTVSFLEHLPSSNALEVSVCTVTGRYDGFLARELAGTGVTRYDLGARRLADRRALTALVRLVRRHRIDLVHAHGQDASILAAAARMLCPIPLLVTRHVLDEPRVTWREKQRARLALSACRHADCVVAPSSATAARLAELTGLAREEIRVILNGVPLERFRESGLLERGSELRKTLGFGPDDYLLLVPAVLREGKGHEDLLKLLPELCAKVPHLRMVFAGGGELEDKLRQEARQYGDAVSVLGHRDDIPVLLATCNLVVLASKAEALPTVLIEAAAAGRPSVATNVGGAAEVVEHGQTGLLVPADDPAALTDAVISLHRDPARARTFGEAAYKLADARFAIQHQIESTLSLWSEISAVKPR